MDYLQENSFFIPSPSPSPQDIGTPAHDNQRTQDLDYLGNYILSAQYPEHRALAEQTHGTDPYVNAPEEERKCFVGRKACGVILGNDQTPDMYFRQQNLPIPDGADTREKMYMAVYDHLDSTVKQAKQKQVEEQKTLEQYGQQLMERIDRACKGTGEQWTPKEVELMNRAGISPDIINRVRNGYAKLPTDFYYVNDEEAARVMLAAGLNKDNLTAEDKKVESILMSLWGQSAYQRYGSTLDRQFDNPVGQFIANQLKPIDNFMMKGEKGLRTFFGNTVALHGDRRTDFTDAFIQHGKGIPFETAQPRYGMKTPPQADRGQIRTINFRAKMKNTMAAAEQAYDEQRSPDYLSGFTSAIGDIVGQSLPVAFPYFGTIGMLASSETQRYEQGVALVLTEEENRKRASLYGAADTVEEKVGMALLGRVPVLGSLINKGIRKTGLRHNSLRAKYLSSQTAQIWGNTVAGVVEEGIAEPIVGDTTRALMSLALNDERGKSSLSDIPGDILQNFQGYHGLALLAYSRGYVKLAEPQIRENVKHFSESLDGFKSLGGSESGYLRALEIKDTDTRNQYIAEHLKTEWANNLEQATRRAQQGNSAILDTQEISQLRELESFRALQDRGVIPRFEPAQETGKYRVYLTPESRESTESRETNPQTTSQPDGESKISQTEQATHQEQSYTLMTQDQLNTLLTLSIGERERSTILWAQNLLAAENTLDYLEQQGWKTENIGQTETTATLRTLARQATATVRILEATGITRQESLQSINPDISEHGTLQSIISSYSASKGRLDTARRRGETNSFASNAYVIRQQDPVNGGFQQVLRYSRGETTVENIWEEIMEQAAINWCTQENIPITAFGSQLQDIQRAVNDIYGEEGGIQFIGLDSAPSSGDIVEALSLMGRSRLMHDVVSGNSKLPSWIQNLIRYLSNFLESFRAKVELGHAIAKLEASGNVAQEIRNLINTMTGAVDAIHAQDIRQQSDIVTAIGESIAEHEASFARAHTTQTKTLEDIRAELDSIAAQRDQPEEVPQGDDSQRAFDTAKEAAVEASVRKKNTHPEDIVGDMMQEGLVNLPAGLTLKTPSQIGADIGINAAPSLMDDLQSGAITENDAYTITQLTKYPAVQQWASEQIKQQEEINNIIPGIQLRDIAAMKNRVWEEAELGHLANYINACKQELEQSDADPKRVAEAKVAYNNIAAHHEIIDAGSAWMEGLPLNSLETVAQPETGVQSPASPDLVRDSQGIQFAASLEKAQDDLTGTTFSISQREDQQWRDALGGYLKNGARDRAMPIKMSSVPSVLKAMGFSYRDLVITPATLDKVMGGKHSLDPSHMEQLAAAIHDPILIVDSATQAGAVVVLTEIKTSKGNVIAAIHLDKRAHGGVYHVVASAYDKNSPWMFVDQIKAGKLRYLDKKKALVWARDNRLQLPARIPSSKGKTNILTPEDVVKWEEKAQDDLTGTTFSISQREDQQWKSSLNNYLANGAQGRIERAKPIKMSSAPSVLQALEYSNRDLVITPAVLDKIMGDKHDLSRSQVEQLAAAIHSPVLIVDSATEADAIVVLTEIKTSRGNVMAAIHIDKNTTQGVYHVVASAYDKNSPWMFIDQIKAGKLRYLDKKKALVWARSGRLQLPSVASHKGKAKVLTPEDVVKWENDQRQSGEVHFSITVNGGQIDLRKAHAVDAKGNKLDKDTYITTPNGSLDWFNFPQDKRTQDILKKKGVKNLPIRLRVGRHKDVHNGFGWIHTLNHFDDMADKGRSPLEHLYNTIRNFTGLYKEGGNRHAFKGEPSFNEGSMLIVELQENEGSYSVISSYPTEKNRRPKGNELLIGRALFRFSPNSAANPFGVAQPSIKAVMAGVSATGKARTSKVQQIPPSVNIYDVDVVDQSGKFIYKEVPKPGINFSLAQASVISKLVLAPRANEARARSLMRGMDEAMNRWNIAASSDFPHDGAARSFGELNSLLAEIQRVLPDKYKINMRPYLNFGAAYARMLETGRIRSYGKLTSEEKTALAEELQSLMDSPETHAAIYGEVSDQITLRQEVAGRGGLEYAQAYRRQEADIVRQLAEGRLNTLLTSLMTDVRGQLEQYLKDESVAKVLDRVARLMPKKKDNGKYGKGSLPADAYRVLGQYVAMLDADAAAVDGEVVKLQNLIQDAAQSSRPVWATSANTSIQSR